MSLTIRAPNERLKLAVLKNGADKNLEMLHNLISLLLTNKTIRSDADKTAEQERVL